MANRIMTSGPQSIAVVTSGSIASRASSVVTTPTSPGQARVAWSTVTRTSIPESSCQERTSSAKYDLGGVSGSDQNRDSAEVRTIPAQGVHDRAKRREAYATGDHDHVAASGGPEPPALP